MDNLRLRFEQKWKQYIMLVVCYGAFTYFANEPNAIIKGLAFGVAYLFFDLLIFSIRSRFKTNE